MEKKLFQIMALALAFTLSVSCSKDDDDIIHNEYNYSQLTDNDEDSRLTDKLEGTSWQQVKSYFYDDDPGGIMTFGYNHIWYVIGAKQRNYTTLDAIGTWYVNNGFLSLTISQYDGNASSLSDARCRLSAEGFLWDEITYIDSKVMFGKWKKDDEPTEWQKVPYRENTLSDSGSSNGGSESQDGIPYVTGYDYTATRNSITVKLMCSERPTNATVKYGQTTPSGTITSSILNKQVSATATGLKPGTKYYFKCTVRNACGSSTSDTFYAMTTY